jgi:transcriptional regulator with XRE-family HTH domain
MAVDVNDASEGPVGVDAQQGNGPELDDYQRRLGARLRLVRRAQGLRLQDVEDRSGGRLKAVVIGSYERGDRAIATHKLATLASFYGVPVSDLLPEDAWGTAASVASGSIRLSVTALRALAADPEVAPLSRLVQHVRVLRGDHHGQVLTLRGDDLRTVAITLGLDVEDLPAWLEARGLLATH